MLVLKISVGLALPNGYRFFDIANSLCKIKSVVFEKELIKQNIIWSCIALPYFLKFLQSLTPGNILFGLFPALAYFDTELAHN